MITRPVPISVASTEYVMAWSMSRPTTRSPLSPYSARHSSTYRNTWVTITNAVAASRGR